MSYRSTAALALLIAGPAHAFRPTDGTDGGVADEGAVEIALGPTFQGEMVHTEAGAAWGIGGAFELGFSAAGMFGEGLSALEEAEVGVSGKALLREGALQGDGGVSVAIEGSASAPGPDTGAAPTAGLTLAVSYAGDVGALHANAGAAIGGGAGLGALIIAEGPGAWWARPVAQLSAAWGPGGVVPGALLGGALDAGGGLTLDAGAMAALVEGAPEAGLRAGLTLGW